MSLLRQTENSSSVFLNIYDLTPDINKYAYFFGLGDVLVMQHSASDEPTFGS